MFLGPMIVEGGFGRPFWRDQDRLPVLPPWLRPYRDDLGQDRGMDQTGGAVSLRYGRFKDLCI